MPCTLDLLLLSIHISRNTSFELPFEPTSSCCVLSGGDGAHLVTCTLYRDLCTRDPFLWIQTDCLYQAFQPTDTLQWWQRTWLLHIIVGTFCYSDFGHGIFHWDGDHTLPWDGDHGDCKRNVSKGKMASPLLNKWSSRCVSWQNFMVLWWLYRSEVTLRLWPVDNLDSFLAPHEHGDASRSIGTPRLPPLLCHRPSPPPICSLLVIK